MGLGEERDMRLTDKERQQEIWVFFPVLWAELGSQQNGTSPVQRLRVFLSFVVSLHLLLLQLLLGWSKGLPFWGMCSPGPNRLHSSQVKPGRIAVGFGLTWIFPFSVWGLWLLRFQGVSWVFCCHLKLSISEWVVFALQASTSLDNFSSFPHFCYL